MESKVQKLASAVLAEVEGNLIETYREILNGRGNPHEIADSARRLVKVCEEALHHTEQGLDMAGWKLVPLVPTEKMGIAGCDAVSDMPNMTWLDHGEATACYRAMIAAAPKVKS